MKAQISHLWTTLCLLLAIVYISCSKVEFLNEKPEKSLVIPTTLEHMQALLDMDSRMNGLDGQGVTPQLGESGADNFYLTDADFNGSLRLQMQNYYTWASQPYAGVRVLDWEFPYRAILVSNTVLEAISNFERNDENRGELNFIRSQALFHRAYQYYQLAQVFAPPYEIGTTNGSASIPLRLSADINEPLLRSTVQRTYDLVLDDLLQALPHLRSEVIYKHRPSKQAGYALMARVLLTMRDYGQAKLYADSCLFLQNELYDYNLVDVSATFPFVASESATHPVQKEIIFNSLMISSGSQGYPIGFNHSLIDTSLLASYASHDLRRRVFFETKTKGVRFVGSYGNFPNYLFSGLAVDEVLLIRSECNIRLAEIESGLEDLNRLLSYRWESGMFTPYENLGYEEALSLVLQERRKELLYRGLRWSDLRRLNLEDYDISLIRKINGQLYTLPANSDQWVWPFPDEVLID